MTAYRERYWVKVSSKKMTFYCLAYIEIFCNLYDCDILNISLIYMYVSGKKKLLGACVTMQGLSLRAIWAKYPP